MELHPLRRTRYFYGKRLDVGDFEREQEYFMEKLRLCIHYAVGCGVLFGLTVTNDGGKLCIAPGAAVDREGRIIAVPEALHMLPEALEGADKPGAETLTIRYCEQPTDKQYCPFSKKKDQLECGIIMEQPAFSLRTSCPEEEIALSLVKRISPEAISLHNIQEQPVPPLVQEALDAALQKCIPDIEKKAAYAVNNRISQLEALVNEVKGLMPERLQGRLDNIERELARQERDLATVREEIGEIRGITNTALDCSMQANTGMKQIGGELSQLARNVEQINNDSKEMRNRFNSMCEDTMTRFERFNRDLREIMDMIRHR